MYTNKCFKVLQIWKLKLKSLSIYIKQNSFFKKGIHYICKCLDNGHYQHLMLSQFVCTCRHLIQQYQPRHNLECPFLTLTQYCLHIREGGGPADSNKGTLNGRGNFKRRNKGGEMGVTGSGMKKVKVDINCEVKRVMQ